MTRPLAVCVYCGSIEGLPEHYLRLAADVGSQIAARGWQLVSGGGKAAMMGALGAAARAGGARTTGVIPQALVDLEWADHDSDELLIVETMRERKALMEAHADAFLALPGGVGTCEELFEVWTAGYLGMHRKPVVLLDPDGHYAGLLEWVRGLGERGFVRPEAIERLVVATDVSEALDACAKPVDLVPPAGSPPHISTAQLPAGRTGESPEYVQYEDDSPAHPAETWIRRYTRRTSGGGH